MHPPRTRSIKTQRRHHDATHEGASQAMRGGPYHLVRLAPRTPYAHVKQATMTTTGWPDDTQHVVAPPSCRVWFSSFSSTPEHAVHHVGERDEDAADVLTMLLKTRARHFVFHSSHKSLRRDVVIGKLLSSCSRRVLTQTHQATRLGLDKIQMKEFFADVSVPTPATPALAPDGGRWVVKQRYGTEGHGLRLVNGPPPEVSDHEYVEEFIGGEEWSVVAFSDDVRSVFLPLVWKGMAETDLCPPYRRMRLCPEPTQQTLQSAMIEITQRIIDTMPCRGWVEVEFVVDPQGVPMVLEINPRVSGTMRIAAMAAQVAIFDIPLLPELPRRLPATSFAIEVPWPGPAIIDPLQRVFATSRLTVAAPSREEAAAKLAAVRAQAGVPVAAER